MSYRSDQPPLAPHVTRIPRARRWLWAGAGWLFVGIGTVGLFLPILPSTVFFIIAAGCFARSYPRWEHWLLNLPRIGPLIRDYRAGYGMPRRAKIIAVSAILVAVAFSLILTAPPWPFSVGALLLGGSGIAYILYGVPTRERVLQLRQHEQPAQPTYAASDERPG